MRPLLKARILRNLDWFGHHLRHHLMDLGISLGISWALTGLETAVFRGYSWLLVVCRGDTKTLANKGFWGDFPEHPQRDSNPCRHLERVVS